MAKCNGNLVIDSIILIAFCKNWVKINLFMIKFDVVIISNPNAELCRNMARMPEPGELGVSHTGLNLPKRFTNLRVLDSSSPQNEKRLSYRKQKSCLGSKLNFVFYTCLPHFTLGLTILVDFRKVRQVYVKC